MFPVMRTRTPELTVEQIPEKLCNLLCNYRESTKATSLPETQLSEKNELSWESLSIYFGPGFRRETYCLLKRLAQSRSLLLVGSAQVVSRPRKKVSRYEAAPFD